MLHALILAGGQSLRMGVDKLSLLRIPGQADTVLSHVVQEAYAVAQRVTIIGGTREMKQTWPADIVYQRDREAYQGPLQALANAWPEKDLPHVKGYLVLAGDLPGLQALYLQQMWTLFQSLPSHIEGLMAVYEGRWQPLVAIYRPHVGMLLRQAAERGEKRILPVLQQIHVQEWQDCVDDWGLRPIHTPEDYQAWLQHIQLQSMARKIE